MHTATNKFTLLTEIGAGEFAHLNGSLQTHLIAVYELMRSWGANMTLCNAGLYHAAYGTSGYAEAMVSTDQRLRIADIVGKEAEAIIYLYCACDRDYVWPRIGPALPLPFKSRFTGKTDYLSLEQVKEFCELTAANELQIADADPAFAAQHSDLFRELFGRMAPYLSNPAIAFFHSVFGSFKK